MFFELEDKFEQSIKPKDMLNIYKRNEKYIDQKIKTLNGVVTELHNPESGKIYVFFYDDPIKGNYFKRYLINLILN
jgi:hypothetical protein